MQGKSVTKTKEQRVMYDFYSLIHVIISPLDTLNLTTCMTRTMGETDPNSKKNQMLGNQTSAAQTEDQHSIDSTKEISHWLSQLECFSF